VKTYSDLYNQLRVNGMYTVAKGRGTFTMKASGDIALSWLLHTQAFVVRADGQYKYKICGLLPKEQLGLKFVLNTYGPIRISRKGGIFMCGDTEFSDGMYDSKGARVRLNDPNPNFLIQDEHRRLRMVKPVMANIIYGSDGEEDVNLA
jgi:hypothetical protein